MIEPRKNPGLLPHFPRPKDWLAGGPSGIPDDDDFHPDWKPYLPFPHEKQFILFGEGKGYLWDTSGCTKFGLTDTVEEYEWRKFGVRMNYSERWLYIMSGQTEDGDSLYNSCETIRKYGMVPEEMLPWEPHMTNFELYTSITPEKMAECIAEGKKWLQKYKFSYEFSYDDFGKGHRWNLGKSPLFACGLYAYESMKDANGVYHPEFPNSERTTHAFVLNHIDEVGRKDIEDSYEAQGKRLSHDFRVPTAVRIHIAKRETMPVNYYPPKNSLVIVPSTGERMMYVDGDQIFKDDAGKILLEVTARNSVNGVSSPYPIVHVEAEAIKHLKRIDLSRNPV